MKWWDDLAPDDHPSIVRRDGNLFEECCHSSCTECDTALFAVVVFEGLTPTSVSQIGREENWPREYP